MISTESFSKARFPSRNSGPHGARREETSGKPLKGLL